MYRLRGHEIPEAGRNARGYAVINILSLEPGEKFRRRFQFGSIPMINICLWPQKWNRQEDGSERVRSNRTGGIICITLVDDDELVVLS